MKTLQIFKIRKSRISYLIHLLGLSALLSVFPANRVLSGYPSLYSKTVLFNSGYDQCKAKVNKVANLVFSEFETYPGVSGYFRLIGKTTETRSALICIESEQGAYFVLSTSNDSFADINNEGESVYQRLSQYMLND